MMQDLLLSTGVGVYLNTLGMSHDRERCKEQLQSPRMCRLKYSAGRCNLFLKLPNSLANTAAFDRNSSFVIYLHLKRDLNKKTNTIAHSASAIVS